MKFILFLIALPLFMLSCEDRDMRISTENKGGSTMEKESGIEKIVKSDEEWKKVLTPEQFHILRKKGTERAFTGEYWNTKEKGIYLCAGCELELFSSDAKFDSGTGWPSYYQPVKKEHIAEEEDNSWWMKRTEVKCARCDGHLGHLFDDGPAPTGLRYCINSVSLKFVKK